MMGDRQGFTLIELAMVVAILAVLAATALPIFLNVANDHDEAAVRTTGDAFSAAVAAVHARWMEAGGRGAVTNLSGIGDGSIDTTAGGWPADGGKGDANSTTPSVSRCIRLWNALLEAPPSISVGTDDSDYQAAANSSRCEYRYNRKSRFGISYDLRDGGVTVDANR